MSTTKEQIYDSQIEGLMTQVIKVCQEHGIAMIASFAIPTPDDADLACTTLLPDENNKNPSHHLKAYRLLRDGDVQAFAITITGARPHG